MRGKEDQSSGTITMKREDGSSILASPTQSNGTHIPLSQRNIIIHDQVISEQITAWSCHPKEGPPHINRTAKNLEQSFAMKNPGGWGGKANIHSMPFGVTRKNKKNFCE